MKSAKNILTMASAFSIIYMVSVAWTQERQELVQRRTENSRTFLNRDGTLTTEFSISPRYYRDARDEFVEADNSFKLSSDPLRSYEISEGAYRVYFDKASDQSLPFTFRTRAGVEIKCSLESMAYFDRPGKQQVIIDKPRSANAAVDGRSLRYDNVFSGINVEYVYTETQLKENLYLSQDARERLPDPKTVGFKNTNVYVGFLFKFEIDSTMEVFADGRKINSRAPGNPKAVFDYEGEEQVDFKSTDGDVKFYFPVDYAFMQGETSADTAGKDHTKIFKRFVTFETGDYLFAGVPYQWLQKLPTGEVVIDPAISIQPPTGFGKDAYILESSGGNDNFGANVELQIGPYGYQPGRKRKTILQFDLGSLPQGAIVQSASLQLYLLTRTGGTGISFVVEAHQMTRYWAEGPGSSSNNNSPLGCDWVYADQGNDLMWPGAGMVDAYSPVVLSTVTITPADVLSWKSWEIGGAVSNWLNGQANYGVALFAPSSEDSKNIYGRFASNDYTVNPDLRPKLEVTYTVDFLAEYKYNPSGTIEKTLLNDNQLYTGSFNYHNRDWVTGITYMNEDSETLLDIDYIHDDKGNITDQDYTNGGITDQIDYTYDNLDRLRTANSTVHNDLEYAYDLNGNIVWKKINGGETAYDYGASGKPNRLTSYGDGNLGYDANGNVTTFLAKNFWYDYRNQLAWASENNEYYFYDADGLRVRKTGVNPIYSENFDGYAPGSAPAGWYMTGINWKILEGEAPPDQELVWDSSGGGSGQCSTPSINYTNFQAEFDLKADGYFGENYWAAFAFRKTNYTDWYNTSGYMVYYEYDGHIALYSATEGILVRPPDKYKDLSTWRHVKITAYGSNIKVYVDGNLQISYTTTKWTSGYFGFNVYGVQARYDNLAISGNTVDYYIRDLDGSVVAEYHYGTNLAAEYVYANGQRIAKVSPSGDVQFYLNDHLGSARAMIGNGWRANYYPYGEIASQSGASVDTRYDFTGHERDQGTGLIYAGARFYHDGIGRWMSVDPLSQKFPWWSPYVYTGDNPIGFIDPNGQWRVSKNFRNDYPRFYQLLNYASLYSHGLIDGNRIVRDVFSNLNREYGTARGIDVSEFALYSSGPEIIVGGAGNMGMYSGRDMPSRFGKINFNTYAVKQLEASSYGSKEWRFWFISLFRTLLHETAHWATWELQGINEDLMGYGTEIGENVEEAIFGNVVDQTPEAPITESLQGRLQSINLVVDTREDALHLAEQYRMMGFTVYIDGVKYNP